MKPKLTTNEWIKIGLGINILFGVAFYLFAQGACYRIDNNIVFGLAVSASFLVTTFYGLINWWPEFFFGQPYKKTTPTKPNENHQVVVSNELPDITANFVSPYLKQDAMPTEVKVDGKVTSLYNADDIRFDFKTMPHTLLAGSSGSGKTVSLFYLIRVIMAQYPSAKFVVFDYGNEDFTQTYPCDLATFQAVTDALYFIMRGRQQEKTTTKSRIIWVVEEFESVLAEVKLLPKDAQNKFYVRLANLGRMGRKQALNMVFVTQSAKAEEFNTSVRNNFSNRFIMNMENDALARALGCSYSVGGLPVGVAYNSAIKSFVKFPLVTEPALNLIPYRDLIKLGDFYRNKYEMEP